jgi:cellulose synthase/poly-beta-1,6-N-acetylglucosamine synthase-like glycosyltransferase
MSYTQLQARTPSCHHRIVAEHLDFTGFQRPRQSHERISDGSSGPVQRCKRRHPASVSLRDLTAALSPPPLGKSVSFPTMRMTYHQGKQRSSKPGPPASLHQELVNNGSQHGVGQPSRSSRTLPNNWSTAASRQCDTALPERTMKLLFWLCLALVAYAYFGYAIWLWLQVRLHRRPILKRQIQPDVSIIIAARNEEENLPAKLENLRLLDYPKDRLQIFIASDGSTDRTASILREQGSSISLVILDQSNGKACALNEAVKRATGDILVFQDARQLVDPDAISELVSCFADSTVGAVSGELLLETSADEPTPDALGIYWKIEKVVRKLESESGSVVGVTGAIYAVRRELYTEIPPGTILDDVFVPMHVARAGKRVVFQPSAIARDQLFSEKGKEFSRKVRTLTGNYQLLQLAPWLLSPANPLLFRLISHKLLRLLVPLLLILMLMASALSIGPFYRSIFWLQILFYALAAVGMLSPTFRRFKPVAIASTFVMLNTAAALAFYNFIAGRNRVWV